MRLTRVCSTVLVFIFSILMPTSSRSAATSADEKVVEDALKAIDVCLHWGGEDAYDEERSKDISQGVDRDCPEAQRKANRAYKLFPNEKRLSEPLLALHDFGYFDLSKDEKERLCQNSILVFKQQFEKMKFENPFVRSQCPEQAKRIYGK